MESQWKIEEEKATKLKNEGNELFNQGKIENSLAFYEIGLKKWRTFLEKTGHNFEETENHLLSVFYSNIGLCHKNLYTSGDIYGDFLYYGNKDKKIIARTGVNRLEAALISYSEAISADPLWEKPHLRKSVVFQLMRECYMSPNGCLDTIDAAQDRSKANFIVDLTAGSTRRKIGNQVIFNCFHAALEAAKSGDKIFLEPGVYIFKRSVKIDKQIAIIGASTGVILRCNAVGGGNLEEARKHPVAAITLLAHTLSPEHQILLKRLRFQMMVSIKSGFKVSIEQCMFEGESHFVVVQVDPLPKPKNKIPKEWRKMVNWDGNLKKKYIESVPIILDIRMCVFYKCWRKNPLLARGEAVHVHIENCMFQEGLGIVVRFGAVMTFKDCELKAKEDRTGNEESNLGVMCSNKSKLQVFSTNVITGRNVSGVAYAYRTMGHIDKSFFQYNANYGASTLLSHIVIEEANVTVSRTNIQNRSTEGLKDEQIGIAIRRQYSSASKVTGNKFVNCVTGLHLNNGASPNVHKNTFTGLTRNHIFLSGGAKPNMIENVFDLTEKAEDEASLGVVFKGGSGGIFAKNRFITGATSVSVDEKSMPFMQDNVYINPKLDMDVLHADEKMCHVTFYIYEGNTIVNTEDEEKELMESLVERRKTETESLRLCAGCDEFKACDVCGKCKSSYYCSPECQRADWVKHEKDCYRHEKLRKTGGDVFLGGRLKEPCEENCPNWNRNRCAYCYPCIVKG